MHSSVHKCFEVDDFEKLHPFAVKITRDDDEEKKIANRNEFNMLNKLNHKNIVKCVKLFENELKGEMHIVMQYIEGVEILDQIAQQPLGVYTEMQAKSLFR